MMQIARLCNALGDIKPDGEKEREWHREEKRNREGEGWGDIYV